MRYILLIPVFLIFTTSVALGGRASNATELRELLMAGHHPAIIELASHFSGCIGPNVDPPDCSTNIDGLIIRREREVINREGGGRILLKQYAPGDPKKELPEMDWNPDQGYKVLHTGRRWGTCLEFSHAGLGKSGRNQRWSTVVLVPWKGSKPGAVAHRFVGYWLDCDSLVEGSKAGEIMLPIIEPVAAGDSHLHIVWQHCTLQSCIKVNDSRTVSGDPFGWEGYVVIDGK